jgi:hypothetical protein
MFSRKLNRSEKKFFHRLDTDCWLCCVLVAPGNRAHFCYLSETNKTTDTGIEKAKLLVQQKGNLFVHQSEGFACAMHPTGANTLRSRVGGWGGGSRNSRPTALLYLQ